MRLHALCVGLQPRHVQIPPAHVQFGFIADNDVPGSSKDLEKLMQGQGLGKHGPLPTTKASRTLFDSSATVVDLRSALRTITTMTYSGQMDYAAQQLLNKRQLLPKLLGIVENIAKSPRAAIDATLVLGYIEGAPWFSKEYGKVKAGRYLGQSIINAAALVDAAGRARESIGLPKQPIPADIPDPAGMFGMSMPTQPVQKDNGKSPQCSWMSHAPRAKPFRPRVPKHLRAAVHAAVTASSASEGEQAGAGPHSGAGGESGIRAGPGQPKADVTTPNGTPGADFALDERFLVNIINMTSGALEQPKDPAIVRELLTGGYTAALIHVARMPHRDMRVRASVLRVCGMLIHTRREAVQKYMDCLARDGFFDLACDVVADALRGGVSHLERGHSLEALTRKSALEEALSWLHNYSGPAWDYSSDAMCRHVDLLMVLGDFLQDACKVVSYGKPQPLAASGGETPGDADLTPASSEGGILDDQHTSFIRGFLTKSAASAPSRRFRTGDSTHFSVQDWSVKVLTTAAQVLGKGTTARRPARKRLACTMARSGLLRKALWAGMGDICDDVVRRFTANAAATLDKEALLVMGRVICDGTHAPYWVLNSEAMPPSLVPGLDEGQYRHSIIGLELAKMDICAYVPKSKEPSTQPLPSEMVGGTMHVLAQVVRSKFARAHVGGAVSRVCDVVMKYLVRETLVDRERCAVVGAEEKGEAPAGCDQQKGWVAGGNRRWLQPHMVRHVRVPTELAILVLTRARKAALSRFRVAAALTRLGGD